jgi:hypothetical protein
VFIQNGGTVTTPVLMTADAGNGTYNLNGGTLAVGSFTKNAGTGKIFFNGGTLKATAGWTLGGGNVSATEVRNGGAIIDSNGKNITISQALVHSTTDAERHGGDQGHAHTLGHQHLHRQYDDQGWHPRSWICGNFCQKPAHYGRRHRLHRSGA